MCENCRAYTADGRCKVLTSLKKGKCGFFETEEQYNNRQRNYFNRLKNDFAVRSKVLSYLEKSFGFSAKNHLAQQAAEYGVMMYDEQ